MARKGSQRFASRAREQERNARAAAKRARKRARGESHDGDSAGIPVVAGPQLDRPNDAEVAAAIERAMNPGGPSESRARHPAKAAASRLFVGNLAPDTDDTVLRRCFAKAGFELLDACVVTDRDTGESRGFGFVELHTPESARAAVAGLDGAEWEGRPLRVRLANERR
jgi:hypothetical protein